MLIKTPTERGKARHRSFVEKMQQVGTILAMLMISIVSIPLVLAIATFPGEWMERLELLQPLAPLREALVAGGVDMAARKPESLWSNRLVLRIAVGTSITARPPHRSVRAAFPHTAPTLGV
jgi:hypothetical protein